MPVLCASTDRRPSALVLLPIGHHTDSRAITPTPAGHRSASGSVGAMGNSTTMRRLPRLLCAITLPLFACLPATAQDIYKCVDAEGHTTYSNVPTRTCRKLVLDPVNLAPAPRQPAAKTATPGNFPKVDEQTQKSRDGDRRRILDSELAAEQKNLEQAKKELAQQEGVVLPNERMQGGAISGGKVQERLQPYKDKVALHQRNIEAIQKEIANLR